MLEAEIVLGRALYLVDVSDNLYFFYFFCSGAEEKEEASEEVAGGLGFN